MSKTLEFYYDYGSPAAYLAWTQLPRIVATSGAQLVFKPMLLGGVFQATTNRAPMTVPAKGKYLFQDLQRFAKRYGVAFHMNPHFPINTLTLMRADVGLSLRESAQLPAFRSAVFQAMWAEPSNLGDAGVLARVLAAAGIDSAEVAALAADASVKEALKTRTEEAVARGVFGAPTVFVGQEMFWGQDRLDFVLEALS